MCITMDTLLILLINITAKKYIFNDETKVRKKQSSTARDASLSVNNSVCYMFFDVFTDSN